MSEVDLPQNSQRDTSRDGVWNRLQDFSLTNFEWFWRLINRSPLAAPVSGAVVKGAVNKAPYRPLRLSTKTDYPCWASLTDRTYFTRYLPPMSQSDLARLPPPEIFEKLFVVRKEGPRISDRSTLLFPSFAQWFTNGFMMTRGDDRRRTTTNHQIDLRAFFAYAGA